MAAVAVAVELWDVGAKAGNLPGDDWNGLLDALSPDLNEWVELTQAASTSAPPEA